ncbi:MAG: ABC-F family ATP-binding cassette domain-containing protein [Butyrivibrio sp.]|nr:ABC-F family ATP-binding cassette domain-containing protein [Butyrivibrio sp.]
MRNEYNNLLTMKNVSKAFTDKILLEDSDFSIESGSRIGIIGINGTGKSTLLKLIAGLIEPDEGTIVKGNNVVIGYLSQNMDLPEDMTLYNYVVTENARKLAPKDVARQKELAFELEGEAKTILQKLGFSDINAKLGTLSGGQRKKASLCCELLSKSDILLLDEPTNHLDNAMSEWLQEYLNKYRGALVMVTHDRYFLDLVCNKIVEIDHAKLYSYETNYEGYLQLRAERIESALSTQDKHANILRKEIAWMQRGARARSTKQKAHIQRYEALRDEKKLELDRDVEISAASTRLGKKTIEIYDISKSYGDRQLFKDFTFTFTRNDRVGILGPNGCGKTTLMKTILGVIEPDSGHIEIGETVKIGYYAQESKSMDPSMRVIDYIKDTAEYIRTEEGLVSASVMCERFLFDKTLQYSKIEKLSGGERRRLYLLKVLMEAPNVLILDEPTNDLDISTLTILEDYLDCFAGIVITVSHDRYFLDRVVERMLTFDNNGNITLYNGSYTDFFMEHEEDVFGNLSKATGNADGTGTKAENTGKEADVKPKYESTHALKFSYKEQKEYDTILDDIDKVEKDLEQVDIDISNNPTDFVKLNELGKKKEELLQRQEYLMERYVYLEDLAEQIANQKK